MALGNEFGLTPPNSSLLKNTEGDTEPSKISTSLILASLLALTAQAQSHAFVQFDYPGQTYTYATDIDGSNILGFYMSTVDWSNHGFIYDGSSYVGMDYPGAMLTRPQAIDGVQVAGYYAFPDGYRHGFFFNGMSFESLDHPSAVQTEMHGMYGQYIVGHYIDSSSHYHGCLYDTNSSSWQVIDRPGALNTKLTAIHGQHIAGESGDNYSNVDTGFVYNLTTGEWSGIDYLADHPGTPYYANTQISGMDANYVLGDWVETGAARQGFAYEIATSTWITIASPSPGHHQYTCGIDGLDSIVGYFESSGSVSAFHRIPAGAPSFTSSPLTEVISGDSYSYNITTTDPDGDDVSVTAPTLPAWLQLNASATGSSEGFESGDFTNLAWNFAGSANWSISSSEANQGSFSAQSGPISDNENSEMSVTLVVPSDGEVSFFYKVSSESCCDKLNFYIDGYEQSDLTDGYWNQTSYFVSAGEHTFTWKYEKDSSVSEGSDCAWVDDIVFGAATRETSYTLTGTPGLNDVGEHAVVLLADDGNGSTANQAFTITVEQANTAPVANNLSIETNENEAVAITLSGSDADGDPLTFNLVSTPNHGDYNGGIYTPDTDWYGSDSFNYVANDGELNSSQATVSISVLSSYSPGGDGSEQDPYQIANLEDLRWLSMNSMIWDKFFIQTADIDASGTTLWNNGAGFLPIAADSYFSGSYDGQYHIISDLYINRAHYLGLFARTNGATIQNLGLENVDIVGYGNLGSFIGRVEDNTTLRQCYATGSISGTSPIGGLVGFVNYRLDMSDCHSQTTLSGSSFMGGLVGRVWMYLTITNSYAAGAVDLGAEYTGGLVGYLYAGGTMTNSFWDVESTQQATSSGGGLGLSTADMTTLATYTNAAWDFDAIWRMETGHNNNYPYFQWQVFDIPNTAPSAEDIAVETNLAEAVAITLTGSDPEGDTLSYTIVDAPSHGSFADGIYTPNPNWFGADSFTYMADDGALTSPPATVSITILCTIELVTPEGLSITPAGLLSWGAVENANSYRIHASENPFIAWSDAWVQLGTTTTTTFAVDFEIGQLFFVVVAEKLPSDD
jgi:hypothetical protein